MSFGPTALSSSVVSEEPGEASSTPLMGNTCLSGSDSTSLNSAATGASPHGNSVAEPEDSGAEPRAAGTSDPPWDAGSSHGVSFLDELD